MIAPPVRCFSVISPIWKMPKRFQQQKKRTATRRRRGARRGGAVSLTSPVPFPFPVRQRVTMSYPHRNGISESTVGSGVSYTYSLNSLYDPNTTGVGSQPIGFDQFSALYGSFRVVAVDFVVEFISAVSSAATAISQVVGVLVNATNALPTNVQSWPGLPTTRSRLITNTGGTNRCTFSARALPWKIIQIPRVQYMSSPDYAHTPTGNPARQIYLILYTFGSGSAVSAVTYDIRLIYHVELMQPNVLDFS